MAGRSAISTPATAPCYRASRSTPPPIYPGNSLHIGATRITLVDPNAPPPQQPEMLSEDDLVEEVEDLEEVEEIETLTEEDVIDDVRRVPVAIEPTFGSDDLSVLETLEPPIRLDDDAPIPVVTDHQAPAGPQEAAARVRAKTGEQPEAFEQNLQALADSLPNQPFGEDEIALISARGQVMHAAGSRGRSKRREPVDIFRLLLVICARTRATDIHLEPKTDYFQLRLRIDGLMVDATRMPQDMGTRLGAW